MTEPWPHDTVIRYLLDDLEGPSLDALEEQLIESSELQELVAAVEAELVDDYVAQRLTPERRARFEAMYLSNARGLEQVEFARALRRALPSSSGVTPWQRIERIARQPIAAMLVGLLALAATSTWWMWSRRERPQQTGAQTSTGIVPQQRQSDPTIAPGRRSSETIGGPAGTAQPSPPPHRDSAGDEQPVFALALGGARAVRPNQTVTVAPGVRSVRLELTGLAATASKYEARLMNPDADAKWRGPTLVVRRHEESATLWTTLDVVQLPAGDYILRVSARARDGTSQDVADYAFRLTKLGR